MPTCSSTPAEVSVGKMRRERKRGRVLQWQTQSVMQDYSVSFSTAIDVVFMGETQGFSKHSGPCYPRSTLETKAEGGGEWRGFFPCGLRRLTAAISIPLSSEKGVSGGQVGGPTSAPTYVPSCAGGGIITAPTPRKR